MNKPKILFLGIGNPVPSFIKNRIEQLDQSGKLKMMVVLPRGCRNLPHLAHGQLFYEYPVHISKIPTLLPIIWYSILFPFPTYRLWKVMAHLQLKIRIRTFIKYHSFVRIKKTDVIHLQWLAMATSLKWVRHYFGAPVISSARGSQLTVYPATDIQYEKEIREAILSSAYIHAVSESMLEACVRYGARRENVFVNYNGIDLKKIVDKQNQWNEPKAVRLISTGSLMWRKGYMWQLMLVKSLTEKGVKVNLTIIGDGPDVQGLKYTAYRLGIESLVEFTGNLPYSKVLELLSQAHIYLSTSAAEGLSNAVLEAAASGLPVVAFDCEGMSEVIQDGLNGFIVPFGELNLMLGKVQLLIDSKELRDNFGKKGMEWVAKNFDAQIQVEKMIDSYIQISRKHE